MTKTITIRVDNEQFDRILDGWREFQIASRMDISKNQYIKRLILDELVGR